MGSSAFCLQPQVLLYSRRKNVLLRREFVSSCHHIKVQSSTLFSLSRPNGSTPRRLFSVLKSILTKRRFSNLFPNNRLCGSGGNNDGSNRNKYMFEESEPPRRAWSCVLLLFKTLLGEPGSRTIDSFYTFLLVYSLTSFRAKSYLQSCFAETNAKVDGVSPEYGQKYSAFIGETSRPAVVLLSFLGAKQRQLKKYADFYFSKGYDVYVVFNNLPTAIFPSITQRQARKVLDILEKIPDGQPVFVHAISIGTGIWGLVLEEFRKSNKRLEHVKAKISGVIYDSGPSNVSPSLMANGLYSACPKV